MNSNVIGKEVLKEVNVHEKVKEFECEYKCIQKESLSFHVKATHEGLKDYACDFCEYKCSLRGSLREHIKVRYMIWKAELKNIKCDYCKYKCSMKIDLTKHIKAVHEKTKRFKYDFVNSNAVGEEILNNILNMFMKM